MEFHLAAEVAWGLLPQVDGATDETEDLDEFGDHFREHPKTAGRTFTGGAHFFGTRAWTRAAISKVRTCSGTSFSSMGS